MPLRLVAAILGLLTVSVLAGCPAAGLGGPSGATVDSANENVPDVVAASTDRPHSGGVTALPNEHGDDLHHYFAMDGSASFVCADPLTGVTYHLDGREANVNTDDPAQRTYTNECRHFGFVRFVEGEGDTLHCEDKMLPIDCHVTTDITLEDAAHAKVYISVKDFPGSMFPGQPDLAHKPVCEETGQEGAGFLEVKNEITFLTFEKTDDQSTPPACHQMLSQPLANGIPGLPSGAQTVTIPMKDVPKITIDLK